MLPQLGAALLSTERGVLPTGCGLLLGERAEVLRGAGELLQGRVALLPRGERQVLPAGRAVLPRRRQALLRTAVTFAQRPVRGRGSEATRVPGPRCLGERRARRLEFPSRPSHFAEESARPAAKQSPGDEL